MLGKLSLIELYHGMKGGIARQAPQPRNPTSGSEGRLTLVWALISSTQEFQVWRIVILSRKALDFSAQQGRGREGSELQRHVGTILTSQVHCLVRRLMPVFLHRIHKPWFLKSLLVTLGSTSYRRQSSSLV